MELNLGDRPFVPADPDRVTVYQCGPTVYAPPHIGNLRAAVVWDVLHRVLRRLYTDVVFVRNYTDIDDKIMDGARARGIPIGELTNETIADYERTMLALHVLEPTLKPRATETIPEIIEFIQDLLDEHHAYRSMGHVLFRQGDNQTFYLNSDLDPNCLSHPEETAGYKQHPADFVLWKPSSDDQPGWDSPWGRGRPGWHIECSAMILKSLGPTIDLHVGGVDLKFPHHECECAQSYARNDAPLARYWAHNGMLEFVNDDAKLATGPKSGKMSKSVGNIVTLDGVLDAGFSAEALRYLLLSAHYTQPLRFTKSFDRLEAAEASVKTLQRAMRKVGPMMGQYDYVEPLLDNLNTPKALAKLHELANVIFAERATDDDIAQFISLADVLGLHENYEIVVTDEVVELQMQRSEARAAKDFATADRIRDQLTAMGVEVTDAPLRRLG